MGTKDANMLDHLGNTFRSYADMAKFHGVSIARLTGRVRRGMSIEEALSFHDMTCIEDHMGNMYTSTLAMCAAYEIPIGTFYSRMSAWRDLESVLTTPLKKVDNVKLPDGKISVDHIGTVFSSITAMCEHYGVRVGTYSGRIRCGWEVGEALTGIKSANRVSKQACEDHLGNKFDSIIKMAAYHGVDYALLRSRLRLGWGVKRAITGVNDAKKHPQQPKEAKKCVDHLGNVFNSLAEMSEHYGLNFLLVDSRIKHGWSLEKALTKNKASSVKIADPFGREFNSISNMAKHYGIESNLVVARIKLGWTIGEALNIEPRQNPKYTGRNE